MRKLLAATLFFWSVSASAQTLFYYGKDSVSANEFLTAWHKNNTGPVSEKVLNDYLRLYISSRLKIAEARALGYDTLPGLKADLAGLRQQILPAYIAGRGGLDRLTAEALSRSKKDISLSHIFISFTQSGIYDSAAALAKLAAVQADLKSGKDFSAVAAKYSDDPAAKINNGHIGYITVFTLPYELENLAYATPAGKISALYASKAGYHIFKVEGERKAVGGLKIAQIMLAVPPDADAAARAKTKRLADSLYRLLLKGSDFGNLAKTYSNDLFSSSNNGELPEFSVGRYDAAFENAVLALPANGAISQPFLTAQGYHIVKRLSKKPIGSDSVARQAIRTAVERSDRVVAGQVEAASRIVAQDLHREPFNELELWAYSDSILASGPITRPLSITTNSPLFTIGAKTYTAADWISFAQANRYNGRGIKPYPQLWKEFSLASASDYYQDNLERFNPDFKRQIAEFEEGNLFFEIMQRQVWNRAQTDSVALLTYYKEHKTAYNWKRSADAIVFYTADAATAKSFSQALQKAPASWHQLMTSYNDKVTADSSRFEIAQIPNAAKTPVKPGLLTAPVINASDNTASFAYIIRIHEQPGPRSFEEARGLVINDYQLQLEKEWVAGLEKKYPVRLNRQALAMVKKSIKQN